MISMQDMRKRAAAIRQEHTSLSAAVSGYQADLVADHAMRKTAEEAAAAVTNAAQAAQMAHPQPPTA